MNHTIAYIDATGGIYYAYPTTQSLADWTTYRVQLAEGTGVNIGRYSGTVDSDNGTDWAVFSGATQPTTWNDALDIIGLDATTAAIEVGRVHRSATALAAGATARRTAVADTTGTLDETIGPTP